MNENSDTLFVSLSLSLSSSPLLIRLFVRLSFWKIAVLIMAALVPMFMFEDIKTAFRYLQRRRNAQRVVSDLL